MKSRGRPPPRQLMRKSAAMPNVPPDVPQELVPRGLVIWDLVPPVPLPPGSDAFPLHSDDPLSDASPPCLMSASTILCPGNGRPRMWQKTSQRVLARRSLADTIWEGVRTVSRMCTCVDMWKVWPGGRWRTVDR